MRKQHHHWKISRCGYNLRDKGEMLVDNNKKTYYEIKFRTENKYTIEPTELSRILDAQEDFYKKNDFVLVGIKVLQSFFWKFHDIVQREPIVGNPQAEYHLNHKINNLLKERHDIHDSLMFCNVETGTVGHTYLDTFNAIPYNLKMLRKSIERIRPFMTPREYKRITRRHKDITGKAFEFLPIINAGSDIPT